MLQFYNQQSQSFGSHDGQRQQKTERKAADRVVHHPKLESAQRDKSEHCIGKTTILTDLETESVLTSNRYNNLLSSSITKLGYDGPSPTNKRQDLQHWGRVTPLAETIAPRVEGEQGIGVRILTGLRMVTSQI